jgi:hypothetical protein
VAFLCRRAPMEAHPPLLSPDRAPQGALERVDMLCAPVAARAGRRSLTLTLSTATYATRRSCGGGAQAAT